MTMMIGFIGAGNMASALVGGLLAQGFSPKKISVADPNVQQLHAFKEKGLFVSVNNADIVERCDVLVLAVKPQIMKQVLEPLANYVQQKKPLIISIAAGIASHSLDKWLGGNVSIVRAMPNTPALVQTGATGLYANSAVSDEQKQQANTILSAVGLSLWVNQEALIDSVTAVSGSGPAYFFYVMEAMIAAGQQLGLDEKTARALTLQTALGAAQMAITADEVPAVLRQRVTSKGGTTEQAIAVFDEVNMQQIFKKALTACAAKGQELARILGESA
ncbi:MAG: pyrroline-5-carboxylate reductase [Agitococcus sp.]